MNRNGPPHRRQKEPVDLRLLGGFELFVGDRSIDLPPGGQRLIALLAMRRRPTLRTLVAGTLWLDGSDQRAAANLRSVLWRLNRNGASLFESDHGRLQLNPAMRVDLHEATTFARRLVSGAAPVEDEGGWRTLRADVLPDWYDDWLTEEREHFHQLRLHALEAVAGKLAAQGRYTEGLDAALAAVTAEPLRESAHRAVIGVHLAEGNAAQAVLQYRRCEHLFATELGIPPPVEIRDSIERAMLDRTRSAPA